MTKNSLIRWPENPQDHADFAKRFLRYDPESGKLFWKVSRCRTRVGDEAGSITHECYLRVKLAQRDMCAHRVAWLLHFGSWPDGEIDHINHIRHDNRVINLRIVTDAEQSKNTSMPKINKYGHVGIGFRKEKNCWRAFIGSNERKRGHKHLGYFATKEEAIAARKKAELDFGYHQNHGKSSPE